MLVCGTRIGIPRCAYPAGGRRRAGAGEGSGRRCGRRSGEGESARAGRLCPRPSSLTGPVSPRCLVHPRPVPAHPGRTRHPADPALDGGGGSRFRTSATAVLPSAGGRPRDRPRAWPSSCLYHPRRRHHTTAWCRPPYTASRRDLEACRAREPSVRQPELSSVRRVDSGGRASPRVDVVEPSGDFPAAVPPPTSGSARDLAVLPSPRVAEPLDQMPPSLPPSPRGRLHSPRLRTPACT